MKKLAVGVILILFAAVKVSAESTDEFVSYEDLKPGQEGYGLTVLQGETPEKFKVEFVEIIPNPNYPKTKIILAKLGDPLKNCNVISGMSGSPIYFKHNGKWKLAGALALGWNIPSGKETLIGITPIQLMLNQEEVLGLKKTAEPEPKTLDSGKAENNPPMPPNVLPDSRELKPGDSIALILVKGDDEKIGVGTVTYVKGNRFWAFGHELFGGKKIVVPVAKARIATSLKSSAVGFKMAAEVKKIVGFVEYDNIFAVEGKIGEPPEDLMLPVTLSLSIRNGSEVKKAKFEFQVLKHKLFTDKLINSAAYDLLEKVSAPGKKAIAFSSAVIDFDGRLPIVISDSMIIGETTSFGPFSMTVGPTAAIAKSVNAVEAILNSDLGPKITDLKFKIDLDLAPKIFYPDSCLILDKNNAVAETARLGEEVNLLIGLRSFDNQNQFVLKVPVKIPENLKFQKTEGDKIIDIYIESGNSFEDRDEKKILGRNPQTQEEFMADLLKDLKNPRKIFVQILFPPTARRKPNLTEISKYPKQEWKKVESLDALKNLDSAETKVILLEFPLPKEDYVLTFSQVLPLKLLPAEKNKPKKDEKKKTAK